MAGPTPSSLSSHEEPARELPSEVAADNEQMTPAELAESRRYGRCELFCTLADMALDLAFLAALALVLARPLDVWLASFQPLADPWPRLAVFFLVTMAMHCGVSFPLSVYSGYILEHQFNLSRQSLARWLQRYALKMLLATAFGLAMTLGLFALIWWTGPYWWVLAAVAAFAVSVVLGQLVPILILPLFYKIEPLENEELAQRFQRLAAGTSLRIEGIYRMRLSSETVKANAMLTGLGHTRRVILADTLLDDFSGDEIEVVLAHEIGHHVYRHIPQIILLGLAYSGLGLFLCDRFLRWWLVGPGETFLYQDVPVYALPALTFLLSLLSLALGPLRNALSRHFERQCDRYALRRTGLRDAFRTAFVKLARLNKSDPDPHPLEVWLLHDHPPIRQRLAMASESVSEG